jgi:benzoate/toluate 1,2-dioxygenase reductase subunit
MLSALADDVTTLVFSDGQARQIRALPGQSVVQAALRSGLRLLVDCREGGCGTCKALCYSGRFTLDDYSRDALTDAELDIGHVLACRMQPDGPCVVEFDYPISLAKGALGPALRPASIETITALAPDVVELTLRAQDGAAFDFLPGQYANIELPGAGVLRSYSFCNTPGETRAVFTIRKVPGGLTGAWLATAEIGQALRVSAPFGRFFLRDTARPLVLVGGGTGIAPLLSMLRGLAAAATKPSQIDLVFGVNDAAGLFYRAELVQALAVFPRSVLHLAAMQGGDGFAGMIGTAVDALAELALPAGAHAYLCGPPPMIDAARAVLGSNGVAEHAIFTEAFLPAVSTNAA